MTAFQHISVLRNELSAALQLKEGDAAIDCTAGGGGHTALLLEAVGQQGQVIAIDRDPTAIATLAERFSNERQQGRLLLHAASFSQLASLAHEHGLAGKIQGIAADLGVSSPQIDTPERGFSFMHNGPLDMRMSPDRDSKTAADVVGTYPEEELARIFYEWGEEPKSRQIARAIVRSRESRPITTTHALAEIVAKALPYSKKSKKHPATKVFQALRIYVNDELNEISAMLSAAFTLLRPGGRLAIISFHSLEDRLVKNFCLEQTGHHRRQQIPRGLPLTALEIERSLAIAGRIIRPFPLVPSAAEMAQNSRARSAKLRVLEKLQLPGEGQPPLDEV